MGSTDALETVIREMPKVELHVHLEGTLEPEMAFEMAARNGVDLGWASPDEMRRDYDFSDLQSFLDVYYAASSVLVERRDFHELTWAYLKRAASENVRHAEVFFDPQTHLARGVAFETVIGGIVRALAEAHDELNMTTRLIMCFLRERPEEEALGLLKLAREQLWSFDGIGLDSTEVGNPPSKFERLYETACAAGLGLTAHAGEEGPPEYVWDTLDLLGVSRIDHGVRALEDPALVRRLADERVTLTVCPLSNVRLKVFPSMADHPLLRMLHEGLAVTVNSDDPAYFGGYITENYLEAQRALGLDRGEVYVLAANAIAGAWLPAAEKQRLTEGLAEAFS